MVVSSEVIEIFIKLAAFSKNLDRKRYRKAIHIELKSQVSERIAMREFYVVAQRDLTPELPHSKEWPKIIGYSYKGKAFLFLEGKGHGLMGGELPEPTAKQLKWRVIFITLNAEWFLIFLDQKNFTNEKDFLDELTKSIGVPNILAY